MTAATTTMTTKATAHRAGSRLAVALSVLALLAAPLFAERASASDKTQQGLQRLQDALRIAGAVDPNKAAELETKVQNTRIALMNCKGSDKREDCRKAVLSDLETYLKKDFVPWLEKKAPTAQKKATAKAKKRADRKAKRAAKKAGKPAAAAK